VCDCAASATWRDAGLDRNDRLAGASARRRRMKATAADAFDEERDLVRVGIVTRKLR